MWVRIDPPTRITMECSLCHRFLEQERFRPVHPAPPCRSCESKVARAESDLVTGTQPGAGPASSRGQTAANQPTQPPDEDSPNMRHPQPTLYSPSSTPQSPNVRKSEQLRRFLGTVHEPRQPPTHSTSPEANTRTRREHGP